LVLIGCNPLLILLDFRPSFFDFQRFPFQLFLIVSFLSFHDRNRSPLPAIPSDSLDFSIAPIALS
jgi:hypothetical protein